MDLTLILLLTRSVRKNAQHKSSCIQLFSPRELEMYAAGFSLLTENCCAAEDRIKKHPLSLDVGIYSASGMAY